MNKSKQILAIIGIVILVGLYIATFIAACLASPASSGMFMACIYATIVVPVLIWLIQLFSNLSKKKKDNDEK